MANKLKDFINSLITKWLEDALVFLGTVLIIFTTYKTFGLMPGNYTLGSIFILFGLLIAKK